MKELLEVFYEPGKVFDRVREQRIWVVALVAVMIVSAAIFAYSTQQIGPANVARKQVETNKMMSSMPQEAKDQMIAQAGTSSVQIRNAAFAFAGTAVFMAILAALFMAIGNLSGGQISFKQAMGTACYSAWPFMVLTFILTAVVLAMAQERGELDVQHILAFNLGAVLDKATINKALYSLAQSIDLIRFAQLAFAAFALAKVAKISFTKSLVGQIAIWAVFTALGMVGASLF